MALVWDGSHQSLVKIRQFYPEAMVHARQSNLPAGDVILNPAKDQPELFLHGSDEKGLPLNAVIEGTLGDDKSSGIDGDAGDWTKAGGEGKEYPDTQIRTAGGAPAVNPAVAQGTPAQQEVSRQAIERQGANKPIAEKSKVDESKFSNWK